MKYKLYERCKKLHNYFLNSTWENGMITLTNKCNEFAIDREQMTIKHPSMTSKGFEVVIYDNKPRRIYARIIWAAEYSDLVAPHTRYLVTCKRMKK